MKPIVEQTARSQEQQIAHIIKDACIQAALEGYEDAAMNGLCCEGAWEAAIGAVRMLDLHAVLKNCNASFSLIHEGVYDGRIEDKKE